MKRFLSMIIAAIMAFGCFAVVGNAYEGTYPQSKYDATKYTTTYVCTKMVEKSKDGGSYTTEYSYDNKGNLIKQNDDLVKYDSKGNLISKIIGYDDSCGPCTYTYDSKNNLIKSDFKGTDGINKTTTYTYDSNGLLTKYVYKESGGYKRTTICSYNSNGQLIKETTRRFIFFVVWSTTYSYNSKGYLTEKVCKIPFEGDYTYTYTYDSNGILIKENYTISDGYFKNSEYTHDSKGNITKSIFEDSYGDKYTYTYYYNSKNLLVKEVHKDNDGVFDQITFNYDSKGNLSKEVEKGTSTTTYTYKKIPSVCIINAGNSLCDTGYKIHIQYATCKYTGKAKTPNITIDYMNKGVDYKVTYSNNVKVGTAKAKIIFLGEYATQRPITITFKITK